MTKFNVGDTVVYPHHGAALIEAVRAQTRTVDLKEVNRVLIQPHWRKDSDAPAP